MKKRISRNVWIVASVSVALLSNMCAIVAGGPVERLFSRKDLPHGPAFGFYRTVWHEWPGTHEQVRFEPNLAEELPYESAPEEGPELFPQGDLPEPDLEPDDPSPEPPTLDQPPGLENMEESDDDPVPSLPSQTPMEPTDTPERPTDEAPATPSEEFELPPGLEETDEKPKEAKLVPPNRTRHRQAIGTVDSPNMPMRIGSVKAGPHRTKHESSGWTSRRRGPQQSTNTSEKRNSAVIVLHSDSHSNEQHESELELAPLKIHSLLRAVPVARPLAPAKLVPALRSVLPTTKQVNYTTRSAESDVRIRRQTNQPQNRRQLAMSAATAAERPLSVNPLRASESDAAANGIDDTNPLRTRGEQ